MNAINPLASTPDTLFFAATRGGKYSIAVSFLGEYNGVKHYTATQYTNNSARGSFGGNFRHTVLRVAQTIHDSAFCDKINYTVTVDNMGVGEELAKADRSTWFPASLVNAAA